MPLPMGESTQKSNYEKWKLVNTHRQEIIHDTCRKDWAFPYHMGKSKDTDMWSRGKSYLRHIDVLT